MENLPEDCLRILLGYLSFDDVSKLRPVCKRFNVIGGQILNNGFKNVKHFHTQCMKEIKESLPRRESERRNHHLYPRHDVLQAIETRLSLLTMTYNRFISEGQICFIPGKVLDELLRILHFVKNSESQITHCQNVPLLQELRDISSMAMEHFDEHILPAVDGKEKRVSSLFPRSGLNGFLNRSSSAPTVGITSSAASSSSQQFVQRNFHQRTVSKLKERISSQGKAIVQLRAKTKHLENLTTSLSLTVNEQKGHISEIVKQLSVVQGLLGVQTSIASHLEVNAGGSGDLNNNAFMAQNVKVGGKRPLTTDNLDTSCDSKKICR